MISRVIVCDVANQKCATTVVPTEACVQTVRGRFYPGEGKWSVYLSPLKPVLYYADCIHTSTITVQLIANCFRSDGGLVWCVHSLREFNRPCQRVTVHWSDTHDYFHIHSFTRKPQKLWSTESSKCSYRFVTPKQKVRILDEYRKIFNLTA